MGILFGSVMIAISIPALCLLAFGIYRKQKILAYGLRHYLIFSGFSLLVSFLLVFGIANLLSTVLSGNDHIFDRYPLVFILIGLLSCLFFICQYMISGSKNANEGPNNNYSIIRKYCIGVAAVLFCEIFIFNYLSFVPSVRNLSKGNILLRYADLDKGAKFSGDAILIGEEGGSVSFRDVNLQTCCFQIKGTQNHKICKVNVEISDENLSAQTYSVGSYDLCVDAARSTVLPVYSTGKIKAVKFNFNGESAGLRIEQISVNLPDFNFSYLRFLVLTILVFTIILIKRKKLWRVLYQPHSLPQNLSIVLLAALLCFLSVLIGKIPFENTDIAYPLEKSPENYGCYVQQFDAFQKGQLNLDIPVDPKLAELKNPYDTSARSEKKVPYSWDRAYYNGKYYSYYGVVPVFVVYYPYYFLHGCLPYDFKAAALLSLFAIPLMVLLIRELVCYFCKKVNFLLLLLAIPAVVFSSLIYTLQSSADFYNIPYLSAILFLSLFLFLAFRAAATQSIKRRAALLVFSGVSYVLAVGSRPITAIFILVGLPVFLQMISGKEIRIRTKIGQICAFGIPVFIGALLMMKYNYDRFASPFEFGINYQLTIDNAKYNTVSLLNIIPTIYHYFFQFPSVDAQFPFIHAVDRRLNYYASYKWHSLMLGVMSFPFIWSIFGMRHVPTYKSSRVNKATFLIIMLTSVVIAVLNFSMSGTDIRYITDFAFLLSSLALVIILDFDSQYSDLDATNGSALRLRKLCYVGISVAMCVSILVGVAAIFGNESNRIFYSLPSVYANIERLCMFW